MADRNEIRKSVDEPSSEKQIFPGNSRYGLLESSQHVDYDALCSILNKNVTTHDSFSADLLSEQEVTVGSCELRFRNAAIVLENKDIEYDNSHCNIYRSVSLVDDYSLNQFEDAVASSDQPFDGKLSKIEPKGSGPAGSLPRVFANVRPLYTHLYVTCSFSRLWNLLNEQLTALKTDFMFIEDKCVWSAMFYPEEPATAVNFFVYVNSTPTTGLGSNHYIVEFVRLDGCAMAFNMLFNEVSAFFHKEHIVTDETGHFVEHDEYFDSMNVLGDRSSIRNKGIDKLPLLSRSLSKSDWCRDVPDYLESESNGNGDESNDSESTDESCLLSLFEMSSSDFEDVHVQGLSWIAHECKRGTNTCTALITACPDILKLLTKRLVESKNPEVLRHAATSLSMLAKLPTLHPRIIECGALSALSGVATVDCKESSNETQRQAVQALSYFCSSGNNETSSAVLAAISENVDDFRKLASRCCDDRLPKSTKNVFACLQS